MERELRARGLRGGFARLSQALCSPAAARRCPPRAPAPVGCACPRSPGRAHAHAFVRGSSMLGYLGCSPHPAPEGGRVLRWLPRSPRAPCQAGEEAVEEPASSVEGAVHRGASCTVPKQPRAPRDHVWAGRQCWERGRESRTELLAPAALPSRLRHPASAAGVLRGLRSGVPAQPSPLTPVPRRRRSSSSRASSRRWRRSATSCG